MSLTRRGRGLLVVVAVAELLAITYGARALNAIVAPAVVALLAAAVQARRADAPRIERTAAAPGFPGDERTVEVDIDGSGVASISDTVPDGLTAAGPTAEASLPTTVAYTLTYRERGAYELGPVEVRIRDVLGLVERTYEVGPTREVLVYPPVYQVAGQGAVAQRVFDRAEVERQEFDALREYVPGDPTRDINWKATARDPEEMYVTEFAGRTVEDDLVIAATADAGSVDEMAAAAASVAVAALDAGLEVELRLPDRTVEMGRGERQHEAVLAALARTTTDFTSPLESYALDDAAVEDADILVEAEAEGVVVTAGRHSQSIEELTGSRENPLRVGVDA